MPDCPFKLSLVIFQNAFSGFHGIIIITHCCRIFWEAVQEMQDRRAVYVYKYSPEDGGPGILR